MSTKKFAVDVKQAETTDERVKTACLYFEQITQIIGCINMMFVSHSMSAMFVCAQGTTFKRFHKIYIK